MKCLVTGATGFIGREVCRQLLDGGHDVIPLSRGGQRLADGTPTRALDIAAAPIEERLFSGVDVVIHAAAIAHQNADPDDYRRVNHEATLRLFRCACAAGVPTFIFVSSVKAMGPPRSATPRAEGDVFPAPDAYGASKHRAEEDLRAQSGACPSLLIVRPTLVYGLVNKGNLRLLARGVKLGLPRPPDRGLRSMIALPDMAGLLCALAVDPPRGCHTFIACGPAVYSTRQIYDLLRRASGRTEARAWLPAWAWRAAAHLFDAVRARPAGTTYEIMFGSEVYDGSAVTRVTGWRPTVRLEDVLCRMVGNGDGAA